MLWRNWSAYTVKGSAIKCFRSLDYELQIALSGLKWQVFSHRALMESLFLNPFPFSPPTPTKNFRWVGNKKLLGITFLLLTFQLIKDETKFPQGSLRVSTCSPDTSTTTTGHPINWYNFMVRLFGLTSGDCVSLQASHTSALSVIEI